MHPHEIWPLNQWYCQSAALLGAVVTAWYASSRDGRTEYERNLFRGGYREPPLINKLIGGSILLTFGAVLLFYIPCLLIAAYYQSSSNSSLSDRPSRLGIPVFYVTYSLVCLMLAGVAWQGFAHCLRVIKQWIHVGYESVTDCFLITRVPKLKRALGDKVGSEASSRLCKLEDDYRHFAKSGPFLLHPWSAMRRIGHTQLLELLLTLLREHHPHYYGVAARILAQMKDDRAIPLLVSSLLKGNEDSALALRTIAGENCLAGLLAGVMSVHEETTGWTAGTPLAAGLIIDLGYTSLTQRERVAVAVQGARFDLAGAEGEAAVDSLAKKLKSGGGADVINALRETRSPRAVRPLIEFIRTPHEFSREAVGVLESLLATVADRVPTDDLNSLANVSSVKYCEITGPFWDSQSEYQSYADYKTQIFDVDVTRLRKMARERLDKRTAPEI